jgi:hypothetical protein
MPAPFFTEETEMIRSIRAFMMTTVLSGALLTSPAFAEEMDHGTLAAAIRSADFPCNHVISARSADENTWIVQCNSGTYEVSRDEDGKLTAIQR